jgi:hypothetical protein
LALRANKKISFLRVLSVLRGSIFFNHPFASLTQERQDRKERRKDMFIGPPGQQKHAFLRVLRDLRGSSFFFLAEGQQKHAVLRVLRGSIFFLTARSLRSLKIAKTAKKTAKDVPYFPS